MANRQRRLASAAYRDAMTNESTNAFLHSNLARTQTSDAPVSNVLRKQVAHGQSNIRPLDGNIILRGRRLITQLGIRILTKKDFCQEMIQLLKTGGAMPGLQSWRWSQIVFQHVLCNSPTHILLKTIRKEYQSESKDSNRGNCTTGIGRGNDQDDTIRNNQVMRRLVDKYGPNGTESKTCFWIACKATSLRPADGSFCCDGKTRFPGKYEIIDDFVYETLCNRCKPEPKKGKGRLLNVVKMDRYPHLSVLKKFYKGNLVIQTKPLKEGYFLVYLSTKPETASNNKSKLSSTQSDSVSDSNSNSNNNKSKPQRWLSSTKPKSVTINNKLKLPPPLPSLYNGSAKPSSSSSSDKPPVHAFFLPQGKENNDEKPPSSSNGSGSGKTSSSSSSSSSSGKRTIHDFFLPRKRPRPRP
eukprot:scaffold960_cov175-Amphora_coffeaeformis.AAC.4